MGGLYAQFTVSGEMRTGLGLVKNGDENLMMSIRNTDVDQEGSDVQSNDNFGGNAGTGRMPTTPLASPGRIVLNLNYTKGPFQFRTRLRTMGINNTSTDSFTESDLDQLFVHYYMMINLLSNQIRVSAGKIGDDTAVWNSMGPQMKAHPETTHGIKFEYRPSFIRGLNVGFVAPARFLSAEDYLTEMYWGARFNRPNLIDIRTGILLDGKGDDADNDQAGATAVYRINPMFLSRYVKGFSLWMNGRFRGIPTVEGTPNRYFRTEHWLYTQYASGSINVAGLHTGIETWGKADYSESWNGPNAHYKTFCLYLKPVFGYDFNSTYNIYAHVQADLNLGYDLTTAGTKMDFLPNNGQDDEPGILERLEAEIQFRINGGAGFTFTPAYRLTVYPGNTPRNWQEKTVLRHEAELRLNYKF